MDPNAALARIAELVATVNGAVDEADDFLAAFSAAELAATVGGLDEWLRRGGALPDAWATPTN